MYNQPQHRHKKEGEDATAMDEWTHQVLDNYFMQLADNGYLNENETLKVMLVALIDDEYQEMAKCNPTYKTILDRILLNFGNSSCIFGLYDTCQANDC